MADRTGNRTVLRHGGYSATSVLPGESEAEFKKHHRDLISELNPAGPLEDDIVESVARLLWRKKNLRTLTIAEDAQWRWSAIRPVHIDLQLLGEPKSDSEIRNEKDQVKNALGENFKFVEIGEAATFDGLEKELSVKERLDFLIDRYLKRLLFLRGLKSISSPPAKRINSPPKAA